MGYINLGLLTFFSFFLFQQFPPVAASTISEVFN